MRPEGVWTVARDDDRRLRLVLGAGRAASRAARGAAGAAIGAALIVSRLGVFLRRVFGIRVLWRDRGGSLKVQFRSQELVEVARVWVWLKTCHHTHIHSS